MFDRSSSRFCGGRFDAPMQASCHKRGPLITLMTRVRGDCGRSDRCGDRGTPSAIPGDTSKSGKASPEAQRER